MKAKHRFFIKDFVKTDNYTLENQEIIHQCNKVLRLKSEDFIAVFNGEDTIDYIYKISEIDKKNIQLQYIEEYKKNIFNPHIHLHQALPNKLSKLEFIVQKCSEAGVRKITFFKAQYSQEAKFLSPKKIERLQKIAIESAEQSHRNSIIKLEFLDAFEIENINLKQAYYFHTQNNNSKTLKSISTDPNKEIILYVGPEGGFHDTEISFLEEKGVQSIYLGANILRTESVGFGVSFFIVQNFFNI